MPKEDNVDIWPAVIRCLRQRAAAHAIRVTWCRGHTSEEYIATGLLTNIDRDGNNGADELATQGIIKNVNHRRVIRAARQRKTIIVLQQAMQRDIWRHRHARIEVDKIEAASFEAEAAETEALEREFAHAPGETIEFATDSNVHDLQTGRLGWQAARLRVPAYQWEQVEGSSAFPLQPDNLPSN